LTVSFEVAKCDLKQVGEFMRVAHMVLIKPVEPRILILRGAKVILDSELAELYGVQVKRLNEQVKRNAERFPQDFMFQLSPSEDKNLRSQFATSRSSYGGRRHLPYAFTEHGAIMAATVLSTKRAIEMSVFVVRAFVRLRDMLATNRKVAGKLAELERRLKGHDASIQAIIEAIHELMAPAPRKTRQIGFRAPKALKAR
jgi:phage regulator Rha-like protein